MLLLDQSYCIPFPIDSLTNDGLVEKLIISKLVTRAIIHHTDIDEDIYE
jgi:hypothetical protein